MAQPLVNTDEKGKNRNHNPKLLRQCASCSCLTFSNFMICKIYFLIHNSEKLCNFTGGFMSILHPEHNLIYIVDPY